MNAAPGWYKDPAHPSQLRRWDGSAWTDEIRVAAPPTATEAAALSASPAGSPIRADSHGFRYASTSARAKGLAFDALLLIPIQLIISAFIVMQSNWHMPAPKEDFLLSPNVQQELLDTYSKGFTYPLIVLGIVSFLTFWLYYQVGLTRYGTTLGGRRAGVLCVNAEGSRPGQLSVLIRYLVWGIPTLIVSLPTIPVAISGTGWLLLIINYLWAYWDPRKQALMDKASRTFVISGNA